MTQATKPEPFDLLGGEAAVRAIVREFYEAMNTREPALAKLHPVDARGYVLPEFEEKFADFFVGWLGGPREYYVGKHGHPRLRMRHAHVPIDEEMVRAWMRCMVRAFEVSEVAPELRAYLEPRLAEVAAMMRNQ